MLVFRLARFLILAALGIAHTASAVTFDGAGAHVLTSANLGFTTTIAGGAGSSCATSDFAVTVAAGGATASVTNATFTGCVGTLALAGATGHVTGTGFPWPITRTAAGTFVIDGVHVVATFTTPPPDVTVTLEGTLEGSFNNTTNTATFANSPGLTATSSLGNSAALVSGALTDNLHTLRIT